MCNSKSDSRNTIALDKIVNETQYIVHFSLQLEKLVITYNFIGVIIIELIITEILPIQGATMWNFYNLRNFSLVLSTLTGLCCCCYCWWYCNCITKILSTNAAWGEALANLVTGMRAALFFNIINFRYCYYYAMVKINKNCQ